MNPRDANERFSRTRPGRSPSLQSRPVPGRDHGRTPGTPTRFPVARANGKTALAAPGRAVRGLRQQARLWDPIPDHTRRAEKIRMNQARYHASNNGTLVATGKHDEPKERHHADL